MFDNSDDDKKKKNSRKKKLKGKVAGGKLTGGKLTGGKLAGSKPAEPVVVPEEKEKHLKGPFVKIAGDRETVINSSKAEEDVGKKPKSCFIDAELRTKVGPEN